MELYAKIGTGPGRMIRVYKKRKFPVVGDGIKFKFLPFERYAVWQTGRVTEIRDVGGRKLYLIERW